MLDEFVEWLKEQPDQNQGKASWNDVQCCERRGLCSTVLILRALWTLVCERERVLFSERVPVFCLNWKVESVLRMREKRRGQSFEGPCFLTMRCECVSEKMWKPIIALFGIHGCCKDVLVASILLYILWHLGCMERKEEKGFCLHLSHPSHVIFKPSPSLKGLGYGTYICVTHWFLSSPPKGDDHQSKIVDKTLTIGLVSLWTRWDFPVGSLQSNTNNC